VFSELSFRNASVPNGGAIALPVAADGLTGPAATANAAAEGALERAMQEADFKAGVGDVLTLFGVGPYSRVILVGVGVGAKTQADLEDFGGRVAHAAAGGSPTSVAVFSPDAPGIDHDAAIVARGAAMGAYRFGEAYDRTNPQAGRALIFSAANPADDGAIFNRDGAALASGVSLARDLISQPSNIKSPQWFVDQTRAAFRGMRNVAIEVLDERDMVRLGMGLMLGVGQGSTRPPRLLVVRYTGAARDGAPIAFVGKGITFDTGGISIKPGDGMWRMRYDMAGAAASVGAIMTLAKRGAKVNAIGVAALAENMPDGGAIRPGDVLKSYSGKTAEILNTDAEGRLVLADAIAWVQDRYMPKAMITIATLTGSVRVALGDDYAGLFGNNGALEDQMIAAGEIANEPVWRLPLHPSIVKDIDSDIADVRNVVEGTGLPGASIGAAFIQEWVKPETAWAHLDIAGMAWKTTGTPTTPAGAAGYGVRLFDQLVRAGYEAK
jgi:leucyl aminopeptidase